MEIVAGVSATQFDIVDQGLRDVWEDAPGSAYLFVTSGAASAGCRITGVTDNGNGTERVTVTALPWTPASTATIQRLSFVRLADGGDSGEWLAEGWQSRSLTVVELPHEYAAAETGEQPVFLYRFWQETTPQKVWRYTSFATDVESDGDTFTAKAIDHGELSRGIGEDAETVKITGIWEAGNPFDFGYPLPSELPVEVEILETTFDDPDTTSVIFRGQIEAAPRRGRRVTATARAGRAIGRRRVPSAIIGPRCGYQVYDPDTCGVDPVAFRFSGCTLDSVGGITIRISHPTAFDGLDAQWLTFGWITVGTGQTQERRGVLQDTSVSATVRELVLNFPLLANSAGAAVVAQPGCDGEWATCQDKFNNQNALLHPFVPDRNPTIDAFEIPQSQGGKKS